MSSMRYVDTLECNQTLYAHCSRLGGTVELLERLHDDSDIWVVQVDETGAIALVLESELQNPYYWV